MIQFNLLPDVKLEYIKSRRTKNLVMTGSLLAGSVMAALVVLLFITVNVAQKRHLDNLNKDINRMSDELKGEQDIAKILTVQNQLNSLNGLHDGKPAANRLSKYLEQITPNKVSMDDMTTNFTDNTMTFSGSADSLKSVNEFVDTLKFTKFSLGEESKNAFSQVVLGSFSRQEDGEDEKSATYQVQASFDPVIFDITKDIELQIPSTITTRSVTEKPRPLFEKNPDSGGEGAQ